MRPGVFVDLVAIASPLVVAGAALSAVAVAAISPWCSVGLGALAVGAAVFTWWPRARMTAPSPAGGVRVLAVNAFYKNPRPDDAVRDVLAADADVVVVSELGMRMCNALSAAYPFAEVVAVGGPQGHGVFSRVPMKRMERPDVLGPLVCVRVGGAEPFVLFGAHLPRPVAFEPPSDGTAAFADFQATVLRLAEVVDATEDAVVAGDLNLADRQVGYRRLVRGRLDAMRTVRTRSTFHGGWRWRPLSLRIDHIIVPASWGVSEARRLPIGGSDHWAVSAVIGRP